MLTEVAPREAPASVPVDRRPVLVDMKELEVVPPPADGDLCSICRLTSQAHWVELPCRHRYHRSCLAKHFKDKAQCPMCRAPVPTELLSALPQVVEQLIEDEEADDCVTESDCATESDSSSEEEDEYDPPEDTWSVASQARELKDLDLRALNENDKTQLLARCIEALKLQFTADPRVALFALAKWKPSLTTIVPYSGNKRMAIPELRRLQLKYFPDAKHLVSPFCGGLSFELDCAARGMQVRANDLNMPLILFWQAIQKNKAELIRNIHRLWTDFHAAPDEAKPQLFNQLVHRLKDNRLKPIDAAAGWWLVTKRSHGQRGLASGFSPSTTRLRPNFNPKRFDLCGDLSQFQFSNQDWHAFLGTTTRPDQLLFVDPPYRQLNDDGSVKPGDLYGYKGSLHKPWADLEKHEELRDRLAGHPNWMFIHEDNEAMRDLYQDYVIEPITVRYKSKVMKEIVVISRPRQTA